MEGEEDWSDPSLLGSSLLGPWLWSLGLVTNEGTQGRYSGEIRHKSLVARGKVGDIT